MVIIAINWPKGAIRLPNEDLTDWLADGAVVDPVVADATQVADAWLGAREPEGNGTTEGVGTAAQIPVATRACSFASMLYSGQRSKHWRINFYVNILAQNLILDLLNSYLSTTLTGIVNRSTAMK